MARQQRPDPPPGPGGAGAARPGLRAVPAPGAPADDGDTGTSAIMDAVPHEAAPLGRASAGEVLNRYLHERAAGFLRGLSLRGERAAEADVLMRAGARRIGGALHTFGALTDPAWSEPLRVELAWLSGTLGREPQQAARLARLLDALHRLSPADPEATGQAPSALGAARAGALLERRLTLARTRAHTASLQAVGSARFHALADAIAVLASEVPLAPAAAAPAAEVLPPLADQAFRRLCDAAAALPLHRAAHPYNAEAVQASLGADLAADLQDAPWHRVRVLLRLSRYAAEVLGSGPQRLTEPAELLELHREAAESAAAVAAAARTPRIAPATAYALGVLHADQRHEVEAARFAFSHVWPSAVPAG